MKSPVFAALLTLGLGLAPDICRAAEQSVYQPAGAPADPRVAADWNRYRDYAEVTALVKQLAAVHSDRCRLESLGKSYGGREMWLLTVTNFANRQPEDKAAFWIDGSLHANEIQGTEAVLYTAWFLLESYEHSPFIKQLLDERVFYLMPLMSPDARDAHFYEANTVHTPRTGMRPRDDDSDGLIDEDRPNDLDGDGQLVRMRIADPWGRMKPHPEHPQVLIDARPDERGSFTLLGNEDFDDDGDGRRGEDADGHYDPNRNWPWNWQPNHVDRGDRYPLCILEHRHTADAIAARPHIAGAQSFHNTGGMVTRGPGLISHEYEGRDVAVFDALQNEGLRGLPGYKKLKSGDGLYEVHGSEDDFFYYLHGTVCFVNEMFTSYNYFHKPTQNSYFGDLGERADFNQRILFGAGLVPWHEVSHPDFGPIEVGGWTKNWQRQPPSFMLEEECHRHMAFTLFHANQIPLVGLDTPTVRPLGGDLFEITAAISNERLTPTRLTFDVRNRLNPPDRATISGENLRVIAGLTADNRLWNHPQEQKRRPQVLQIDSIPGMAARYVRWIVSGSGRFHIHVKSVKGGVASIDGELK